MAAETTKLSITVDANEALKTVVARFPEWSIGQLGNKLLLECCHAITSPEAERLSTIDYLRKQLGLPTDDSTSLEAMIKKIEDAAAYLSATKAAAAPETKQAARKRAA